MATTESFTANGLLGSTVAPALPKTSPMNSSAFASNGLLGGSKSVLNEDAQESLRTLPNHLRPEEQRGTPTLVTVHLTIV